MDIVERVARAIDAARGPNDSVHDYARAALAAMLEAVGEPVAWVYEHRRYKPLLVRRRDPVHALAYGWTETPLYSLAALRDAW